VDASQRIDKWLWHARFFKSRTLAAKLCEAGRVRVNRQPVSKPSAAVRAGDLLTFPQGDTIRVIKVLGLGERRGPAPEAQALYEDQTPPPGPRDEAVALRLRGTGRPTKRDRRALERLLDGDSG
jgi:ribosome-associated heat shock protein Hsp15